MREEYPGSAGFDIAEEAVRYGQRYGLDTRGGKLADAMNGQMYAAICMWDTIEYLPDPYTTLAESCRHLRDGGYLFVTTGDFGSRLARFRGRRWRMICPPAHLFYFTRASLTRLCERLGLKVVAFETVRNFRRVGSMLKSLQSLRPGTIAGRSARYVEKLMPERLLRLDISLDLGDIVAMVAQKVDERE